MRRSMEAPSTAVGSVAWPQRYAQLLDAHTRLQQTLAAQEAAHRRARTAVKYDPALPNNDKFTRELLEQNHELTQRCRALELRLAKLDGTRSPRRSVERASRKGTRRVQHASVQTDAHEVDNNRTEAGDGEGDVANAVSVGSGISTPIDDRGDANKTTPSVVPEHVQTLVAALRQRLEELDVDVTRLQHENELLRAERTAAADSGGDSTQSEEQLRTRAQLQELEHLFSDRVRQVKILEEQFAHLQHKVKTKTLLYKESLERVEQLTSELFDAKQTLLKQAEWLHAQQDATAQLQLLEKEVHVLRSENATLNQTVSVLSARPLDALNAQLEKKALQISLLDETNAKLERELTQARQDHRVVMQTNDKLRVRVETLTKQLEAPLIEIQTLKAEQERLAGEREIAQLQLQFYLSGESVESKELMEAVGRALKLMRAERGDAARVRTTTDEIAQEAKEASAFQRERADKMAQVTKLIQEETRAQLQDMQITHQAEVRNLKRQSARWQQRANELLREITTLRRGMQAGKPQTLLTHRGHASSDLDRIPTSTKTEQLSAEANLLEVRVYDLRIHGSTHTPETASFTVFCDYFDFESQHSPVFKIDPDNQVTVAPMELEVSYKLLVDQAFCRSPVAQLFAVELHRLGMGCSTVVGTADASLHSLFLSERGNAAMAVKLLDPTTRAAVGTFRIAASLARPANHLYKAWHKSNLTRVRPMPQLSHPTVDASKAACIHLEIRVVAVVLTKETTGECLQGGTKVRYRFMGNAPVRHTTLERAIMSHGFHIHVINRAKVFEIPGDDQMLAFLERYEMVVETESPSGGRGEAQVPFKSVVCSFRANSFGSAIGSVIVSAANNAVAAGEPAVFPIGRVWFELQAVDMKAIETISPARLCSPVERVFGGDGRGTQVDWHLFCEAMSLSAPERSVRQLLFEKFQGQGDTMGMTRALIHAIAKASLDGDDALSAVFQQAGLQFSRSELSFVKSALFAAELDDLTEDEVHVHRYQHVEGFKRLRQLAETIDSEWLRMEPLLRTHVELLGVLAEYPHTDTEWITWDTFVHRIRLTA